MKRNKYFFPPAHPCKKISFENTVIGHFSTATGILILIQQKGFEAVVECGTRPGEVPTFLVLSLRVRNGDAVARGARMVEPAPTRSVRRSVGTRELTARAKGCPRFPKSSLGNETSLQTSTHQNRRKPRRWHQRGTPEKARRRSSKRRPPLEYWGRLEGADSDGGFLFVVFKYIR